MKHLLIQDKFFDGAKDLRNYYEEQFRNPRETHNQRFVWDYWHVPDQYTLLRTPAYYYFPKKMYEQLHRRIVQWGRENLGCHDISAPWMSYYVNGCQQQLHSDVPHGPWAFVYSLTPWKQRQWSGGETLILKPQVLDYWSHFVDEKDRELNSFVDRVPAQFNRLVVFDPRFPHGVTEVRGTQDPLQARLVIHGWFVEPRPYVVGGLSTQAVQNSLQQPLMSLQALIEHVGAVHGTMSFRIKVSADGQVVNFKWLTNTVHGLEAHAEQIKVLNNGIRKLFMNTSFRKAKTPSEITVPLLFK
ncbi:MAG: 2OG-Fe(II) oxygenase [Bdellovibrionia bacterium]